VNPRRALLMASRAAEPVRRNLSYAVINCGQLGDAASQLDGEF
jgi:hypothetical protein